MDEKNTVETAEAAEVNYDGTLDEEQSDEVDEDASEGDIAEGPDSEEEYFDLDEDEEALDDEEEAEDEDPDDEDPDNDEGHDEEPEVNAPEKNDELSEAVRNLLDALGVKNASNPVEELEKLTADTLGVSHEEYKQKLADQIAKSVAWEAQMKRDIDAIHEAFPVTKKYKSLKELPNKEKFAALMDSKSAHLTAVEAFAASHPDIVKAHHRAPAKKNDLSGTKDHIKSSVPKGAKDTSVVISRAEMEAYREMFPDLSKSEIKKLYKSANK